MGIFWPAGGTCLTIAVVGMSKSAPFGNFTSELFHPKDVINGSASAQCIPRKSGMTNTAVGSLDGMTDADVVDGAVVTARLVAALGD